MRSNQQHLGVTLSPMWGRATKTLIISCAAVFVLQSIVDMRFRDPFMRGLFSVWFGLSWGGLKQWALWQPITYLFLHGDLFHLLLNMLGLYFFGSQMEMHLGPRRFLRLYFMTGALAGIGWLAFSAGSPIALCIGASGAVFGIAGAFAALFPKQRITLLFMFILPINMSARTMAIVFGLTTVYLTFRSTGNVAHFAHLAGGVAGYLWGWQLARRARKGRLSRSRPRSRQAGFRLVPPVDDEDRVPTLEEVDRLLEKVQQRGLKSLTRAERRQLERAAEAAKRINR